VHDHFRNMSSIVDPSEWVEHGARHHADQLFLKTAAGRQCSYATLRDESGRLASALMRLGVVPGDRVAVQIDKSADAVLLYIACLRMGAVFVPINVANTANEVDYFLRDAQPRVAVIRPADRTVLEPLARGAGVQHLETLGQEGEGSLLELARRCDADPELLALGGENSLAAIVYTSGTTGRSKGAMLTRANLGSNAAALVHAWHFTNRDVLLHTLPLFHVHGLFAAINTVLASAASILLLPKFSAALVLEHLPQVTVLMGVPTHYTRLLQHSELNSKVSAQMRLFVSGSAPLLAETHRNFRQRTGHTILERYGMTETLMNTSNPYDGVRKPGSVGGPLPGISVRISNSETGTVERNAEVIGALEITGPNVFAGYWRDADKTRDEFTADGWFRSGDLARIDGEGYVHIVGRAKDVVISGGYNVYPREVETELDALVGVLESAVFGVPHPDYGEGVTAAVVGKPGAVLSEADIINAVQARLARYKIPKRILLVNELPRNTMGKVQKNALRATYGTLYRAS
jgi:malonyl-CoA/methylmalonyl-CoA synthetase